MEPNIYPHTYVVFVYMRTSARLNWTTNCKQLDMNPLHESRTPTAKLLQEHEDPCPKAPSAGRSTGSPRTRAVPPRAPGCRRAKRSPVPLVPDKGPVSSGRIICHGFGVWL